MFFCFVFAAGLLISRKWRYPQFRINNIYVYLWARGAIGCTTEGVSGENLCAFVLSTNTFFLIKTVGTEASKTTLKNYNKLVHCFLLFNLDEVQAITQLPI